MRVKKVRMTLNFNGVEIRTLDELRENFDADSFLDYFDDGTLLKWLETWHYTKEAAKVRELDDDVDIKELCKIFGMVYYSPEEIAWRTERLERLKKVTSDENILAQVDNVAFDTGDLLDILEEGEINDIYLCENKFTFSSGMLEFKNKNYYGVGKVTVKFETDETINLDALGLKFENIQLEGNFSKPQRIESTKTPPVENKPKEPARPVENPPDKLQTLINEIDNGNVEAMLKMAKMYQDGDGVIKNWRKATQFYRKAANLGNATAMNLLGDIYYFGTGVEIDFYKAVEWYRKAAERGNIAAMNNLGFMYENGKGTRKDVRKARGYYTAAANLGNNLAMQALKRLDNKK